MDNDAERWDEEATLAKSYANSLGKENLKDGSVSKSRSTREQVSLDNIVPCASETA